ncbi:MAG: type II toxin-antitoxin system RelE/ParE family toxin [Methylovulum sp.]|uniref:type II toxin-antitoxin system RelE/ParE family toxin n=1 Tax=Methylovulum sp. TaxID=1916980 RepID=UPI0026134166|nr:type II toxin-antitoxin system RelE/ParE family toxin [Methylovulum sp.]MDD2724145.1 type II toxin-antitoxin system RelE/ParE family toxin [Methylovulum sp.]MDD5123177.1 type II toxin-antitoxin system RelE/ParE family toxin [Methylovulum sp.]
MSQVIWLPEALDDLLRLRLFLADKNPNAATRAGQTILEAADRLAQFPLIGRPMDDGTPRREMIAPFGTGAYVLRYLYGNDAVFIIRVWHSKENRIDENAEP